MTRRKDRDRGWQRQSGPSGGTQADVISSGAASRNWPWKGRRVTTAVGLIALAAGLLIGFAGGHLSARSASQPGGGHAGHAVHAVRAAGAPRPAGILRAEAPLSSQPLAVTGNRCAVNHGRRLQLGMEIVNQSGRAVTLRRVRPVLPLGGLREVARAWAACGSLPVLAGNQPPSLAPGATAWLAVTFDVLVRCPGPLPVGFAVSYLRSRRAATADFESFPDLSQIRFAGCRR